MRQIAILLLACALLLLFGCPLLPAEKVPPVPSPPSPPAPEPPAAPPQAPVLNPAPINETLQNGTPAMNGTGGNAAQNETAPGPVEPEVPVSTRNISEKIGEGQFDLPDFSLEPMKVYFISDGLADSILVTKGGFSMLIDAGNAAPAASLISRLGIQKVNVLVATRDYSGAIGGMREITETFDVGEFWYNGIGAGSAEYVALLEAVKGSGIPVKKPVAGDSMNISGLRVDVLNPQKQKLYGNPDSDAVVLKLRSRDLCILLLNPTVQERENALISAGQDLNCEAITYFKHGEGRPTPSLLVENNPRLRHIVISVGANKQGLPSPTTITRLVNISKLDVWRTDSDGTVGLFMDVTGNYAIGSYNESTGTLRTR
jgi:beta-lactamase superfamily II metal-dependent hydrolase